MKTLDRRLALAALLAAALAACGRSSSKAAGPAGPVEVGVVTLAPTSVTLTKELPGRTSAYRATSGASSGDVTSVTIDRPVRSRASAGYSSPFSIRPWKL